MKPIVSFLAGGLLLAASPVVQAQAQPSDMQLQMDRGFYMAAGIGKSRTGEGCFAGPCDVSDRTWAVSAGYQFNRHLAAEIGYVDFGTATVSGTVLGVPATAVIKSRGIELLGVGMLPITERFGFYVKAGIYRSDSSSTTSGAVTGSGKENDNGFTFGGGVQYVINPHFTGILEFQSYSDMATGVIGLGRDDLKVWRVGTRYKF